MSILLLTTLPNTLNSIKTRDPNACQLKDTNSILATKEAITDKSTIESMCKFIGIDAPNVSTPRTIHRIGGDWVLRITHTSGLIVGQKFLNVGLGTYDAPWGFWILYKVNKLDSFSNIDLCKFATHKDSICSLTPDAAKEGYDLARRYTYHYSTHNMDKAKFMNYYHDGKYEDVYQNSVRVV